MDYGYLIKALKDEARQNIQFSRMNKGPRILARLITLPWLVAVMCAVLQYYVALFFYKACLTPVQHLHNIMRKEGEVVKHGTQVVVYLIAFPVIFELYILLSLTTVYFYFQWFVIMVYMYFATLGGVKWQPFITEATFEERAWVLKPSDKAANRWSIICLLAPIGLGVLFGIGFGISAVGAGIEDIGVIITILGGLVMVVAGIGLAVYSVFLLLSPIFYFRKEEAVEESFEEFEELAE